MSIATAAAAFTAWSAGGSFAPIRDIEFRGNYTRSFRSPAILELFLPRASTSLAVPDLCSAANIGLGPVPDIRRANCLAFLARYPGATPLIAASASVPALSGGNPGSDQRDRQQLHFGRIVQAALRTGPLTRDRLARYRNSRSDCQLVGGGYCGRLFRQSPLRHRRPRERQPLLRAHRQGRGGAGSFRQPRTGADNRLNQRRAHQLQRGAGIAFISDKSQRDWL